MVSMACLVLTLPVRAWHALNGARVLACMWWSAPGTPSPPTPPPSATKHRPGPANPATHLTAGVLQGEQEPKLLQLGGLRVRHQDAVGRGRDVAGVRAAGGARQHDHLVVVLAVQGGAGGGDHAAHAPAHEVHLDVQVQALGVMGRKGGRGKCGPWVGCRRHASEAWPRGIPAAACAYSVEGPFPGTQGETSSRSPP